MSGFSEYLDEYMEEHSISLPKLSNTSYRYTGKMQKTDIIVKYSAGNAVASNDYSVIYYNKSSKKVGTYSVKIVIG